MKPIFTSLIILLFSIGTLFSQSNRVNLKVGQAPFFHGVASGDPMSDRVMIWTKVTPPTGLNTSIPVYWQIATDVDFTNIINFGKTTADSTSDYTVKVDVCGLQGGIHYYYVFKALGQNSIIGRTKTAPATGGTDARFGVVSCSSYEHGYFNAYESLSKRNDIDAILHLGDYIYEYQSDGYSSSVVTGGGRTYQPTNEIITLSDYRIRHSHYKLDDQLQLLHQIHPFITTWDDHETANDSYKDGAQNHDASEGPWPLRKVSGTQAYKEYMPLRNPDPANDIKIWRKLRYGSLLDLIVLDSRLWGRDEQNLGQTNNSSHEMLGNDQFTWLETQLSDTATQWKIMCQQVMMAPLEILSIPVNADQWDGYNSERNRLIDYIENNNVENPVVLTGDIHTSWVNNVPGNNTNTAAVEYVVTSVTSPGLDVIETALGQLPSWLLNLFGGAATGVITGLNPHMEYVNLDDHGYMVLTVDQSKAQVDYVWLDREVIDTTDTQGPSYYTNDGVSNVQSASGPVAPIVGGAPVPPVNAIQNLPFALLLDTFELSVTEAQLTNNCLVDVLSPCPNVSTSLIEAPLYGSSTFSQFCLDYQGNNNYYGEDYLTAVFCQTANPTVCDTVVVSLTIIPTSNIDTINFQITNDSILEDCISFNDLYGAQDSLSISAIASGTFTIDSANCFTYESDSSFNGVHYIGLIACDTFGVCDTLVLELEVSGLSNITYVELFGESEELLSNCLGFDDLQGSLTTTGTLYTGTNNALIFNDTCISYTSNLGFYGVDTVVVYGCDNSVPTLCDTIVYWIQIEADTIIDTTGIKEETNSDFAVMGVYPNPFDVELLIQYFQFSNETISISMYDVAGKQIYSESIGETSSGLKYIQLKTDELASGHYFVELSTSKYSYTKKVVKH